MSNKPVNPLKVITGKDTRWSYANLWEAKSINGGTPKFSVSLIIPKSDTVTVQKVRNAIQAAYEEGQAKLRGNGRTVPPLTSQRSKHGSLPGLPGSAGDRRYSNPAATSTALRHHRCSRSRWKSMA